MATHPVATRYARALLDIALERGSVETIHPQLRDIAHIYGNNRDLRAVLVNPSITLEERRRVLRALAQAGQWDPMMLNFTLLLLDKDRIRVLEAIAREFQKLYDEHAGVVRAHVTSATSLSEGQKDGVRQAIAAVTGGKTVVIETVVDPELLGGVVTRVGGTVYDGSVRNHLHRLRESILNRN